MTETRTMSRGEYCGTCHRTIYRRYEDHAFHSVRQAGCDDCHPPSVTRSKKEYSIHDHRFDFSRPPVPCYECHGETMEGREAPPEKHDFNLSEVKVQENLTTSESCVRCHQDKNKEWTEAGVTRIRNDGFEATVTERKVEEKEERIVPLIH